MRNLTPPLPKGHPPLLWDIRKGEVEQKGNGIAFLLPLSFRLRKERGSGGEVPG
jgi:hypothetical protein